MKGFEMDHKGDVVVSHNKIPMVEGESLIQQKVRNVLSTNKGEWFLDLDEGIDFGNMLGKGITEDMVRYEIEKGLLQVDSSFSITEFSCDIDKKHRTAKVYFAAQTSSGEKVGGEYTWA